jgi:hypothetical protein
MGRPPAGAGEADLVGQGVDLAADAARTVSQWGIDWKGDADVQIYADSVVGPWEHILSSLL